VKRLLLVAAVCVLFLCSAVKADTVHLSTGGKVVGTIARLELKLGPLTKVFSREQIGSIKNEDGKCKVVGKTDKTAYVGDVGSVSMRTVAGVLTFTGKSVKSVEFNEATKLKPNDKPQVDEKSDPVDDPLLRPDDKKPDKPQLTDEQRKELKRLVKVSAELRDEYLKKAKELEAAGYEAVRDKYAGRWDTVCQLVEEKRERYAKYAGKIDTTGRPSVTTGGLGVNMGRTTTVTTSGAAAVAVQELNAAEAKKKSLAATIKAAKSAVKDRARLRREAVRRYSDAIYRALITGKEIPEDTIKEVYEKALKRGK